MKIWKNKISIWNVGGGRKAKEENAMEVFDDVMMINDKSGGMGEMGGSDGNDTTSLLEDEDD